MSYDKTKYKKEEIEMEIGIKKELDKLGRILIPKEIRRALNFELCRELELIVTKDGLIIRNPNEKSNR